MGTILHVMASNVFVRTKTDAGHLQPYSLRHSPRHSTFLASQRARGAGRQKSFGRLRDTSQQSASDHSTRRASGARNPHCASRAAPLLAPSRGLVFRIRRLMRGLCHSGGFRPTLPELVPSPACVNERAPRHTTRGAGTEFPATWGRPQVMMDTSTLWRLRRFGDQRKRGKPSCLLF